MSAFEENFRNVPAINTPAYFWFIIFDMDVDELLAQLHDMYDHGTRSVCLHPIPKAWRPVNFLRSEMSPDYLTEEYFAVIRRLVEECEKLGMHYYLYDEGGWPSGGACGQVFAKHPEWKRQWMTIDENGNPKVIEEAFDDTKAMLADVLHPGTTEAFIDLTHENYRRHMPEYTGSTMKIAFMDEPAISNTSDYKITWTPDFAEEFKRRKGYDIVPYLPDFIKPRSQADRGKLVELRMDFHDVRTQLFIERFLIPIRDWCRKNNMLSGGHFDGEDTPEESCRRTYGSILRCLRHLDVPGVDVIWRQIWPEMREHPFPRFASSAAHLEGNNYSLAELYGVFGNGITPEHLRYIIDYVMVHGINLLVYGSYPQRNAKNWTSGCRPHFGPDDPMWKYFDEFHAYSGRASYLLSCGTALRTAAVVFDDRAVWADNYENAAFMFWHDLTLKRLRRRRILFDYIDDDMISSGRIEGTEFIAGAMRYKELVIPEIRKLSSAAEEKISSFIAAGGKVTSSGDEPESMVKVSPDYPDLWVEARQLDDKRRIWFFFHSGSSSIQPQIVLPETETVVLADPLTGEFHNVKLADNGSFTYRFGRYDTAFFITNMTAEKDLPATLEFENIRILSKNWTLQPLVRHFVGADKLDRCECGQEILPAFPGDWRKLLGEDFSGDARYVIEFDWSGEIPQTIRLDLGKVNYCCQVTLNKEYLGKKFRGPFVFDVSGKIKPGVNQLEVIVSNTLANAYSPREVELKMQEKWPRSGYENRQRSFELDSLESGLIGPVMLKF